MGTILKFLYFVVVTIINAAVFFCLVVRGPELLSLASYDPRYSFMMIMVIFASISLYISPSFTYGYMIRRIGLILFLIGHIKQVIDFDIKIPLHSSQNLSNKICIVTGANSGTGYGISLLLAIRNATVVMTCRSEEKCNNAIQSMKNSQLNSTNQHTLNLIPMVLDLSDLNSVKKFTENFSKKFNRLDILVNNAGGVMSPGAKTVQGLEYSFGSMHIGHFALTKWLLKYLLKPIDANNSTINALSASRVINVASAAGYFGSFHPSFMNGTGGGDLIGEITDNCASYGPNDIFSCCPVTACPDTNGYARAKLSNILHSFELQRRVDEYIQISMKSNGKKFRRLVTASLHPGEVATDIHPFTKAWVSQIYLRSKEQAANVILHAILDNEFVPSSFIDAMKMGHDLFNYRDNFLDRHIKSFNATIKLPFARRPSINIPSVDLFAWNKTSKTLIYTKINNSTNNNNNNNNNNNQYSPFTVAARLWDISEQILKDFEKKKPLLSSPVESSMNSANLLKM
eukprot:gene5044-7039_t